MGTPGKVKVNPYGAGTYQAEIFELKAERDRFAAEIGLLKIALDNLVGWVEQFHPEAAKNIPLAHKALNQTQDK